eukprot:TRINITY_DN78216_c0_g1_i1.p1 TRINITY_DN78216_c0_g1~~TRINITY_DN78216_c0_g1_i1.p1  ORF type:complete len:253 (-),score=24.49 TRINITY_DN78216_c0_g1_i1:183-875(-)
MLASLVCAVVSSVFIRKSAACGSGCSFDSVSHVLHSVSNAHAEHASTPTPFNFTLLSGTWYEHAHADPAMAGTSCPKVAVTITADGFTEEVHVVYNSSQYTIVKQHVTHNGTTKGVFSKTVEFPPGFPGQRLVGLPTVVVDAILSADGSRYDSAVIHSCYNMLVMDISELVFLTRSPTIDPAYLQSMIDGVKKRGLEISEGGVLGLNRVDWSNCALAAQEQGQSSPAMLV